MEVKVAIFSLVIALTAFCSRSFAEDYSADELNGRAIQRRAVEAVIWGMPAVNFDLMYQATVRDALDDTGPTADRFQGFRGGACGVGPIVTYTIKIGKSLLDLNARFIPEFGNEKCVQGNLFQFAATWKF